MDDAFNDRRFKLALAALATVVAAGTVGYHELVEEGWISSFYRVIVTVSLTGLDAKPSGAAAKLFTIGLLFVGVAFFAYVAGAIVEMIARGVLTDSLSEKRRRRAIERLRDHYIICGFGRVGRRVAAEFRESGVEYVVLDFSAEALRAAQELGDHFLEGNGTEDEDLRAAGLEHARGLVAASDSDADNLCIALSARTARPDLLIVARASDADAARKLRLAGADRVVGPYLAAGRVMTNLVLKPQVTAFLDVVTTAAGPDLRFEEIEVTEACGQGGRSLRDVDIRDRTGALVVALCASLTEPSTSRPPPRRCSRSATS